MNDQNYFVYITTNPSRSVVYIGMTNNLARRLHEHYENRGNPKSWSGKHYCYNLIWYERHQKANHAIEREKEIKKWRREKKDNLINSFNPDWNFLNKDVGVWEYLTISPSSI